jgi:exonuclease III
MVMDAEGTPSRTDGSGTFSVATWNIRSGRNGGLESALRALEQANVDLAFLTEAKLTGGIHARRGNGYDVIATNAMSKQRGGVALCYRKSDHFEVEETVKHGPNVMAFQLETGRR